MAGDDKARSRAARAAFTLFGLLPALHPAVVLFLILPLSLYLPNQEEFGHQARALLPFAWAGAACPAAVPSLLWLGPTWRGRVVSALFYLGLFLYVSDLVAPIQLGDLTGAQEPPDEPLRLTLYELAAAAGTVWLAFRLPVRERTRTGLFAAALVVVLVATGAWQAAMQLRPEATATAPPPDPPGTGPNVYHLVFDTYHGPLFLPSVSRMGVTRAFDGFLLYPETRANYLHTNYSFPSFMTGTFYREGESLAEWRTTFRSEGLLATAYRAGHEISTYTRSPATGHRLASHATKPDVRARSQRFLLADLWLMRALPNFLQRELYGDGRGLLTRTFLRPEEAGVGRDVMGSLELMDRLIADEAARPSRGQYVFVHLMIPHAPFVLDQDCAYAPLLGKRTPWPQTLCATRLMVRFLDRLRELGRYDDAVIVIQSDHGQLDRGPSTALSEASFRVVSDNVADLPPPRLVGRTRALLMLKPPGSGGHPLMVMRRHAQLADLPATLYQLLGLDGATESGTSLLAADFPTDRRIPIFVERSHWRSKREPHRWGVNLFEADMDRFEIRQDGEWERGGRLHARW